MDRGGEMEAETGLGRDQEPNKTLTALWDGLYGKRT